MSIVCVQGHLPSCSVNMTSKYRQIQMQIPNCIWPHCVWYMATKAKINTSRYYLLYEKSRRKSSFFVQSLNFFERLYQEVGISYTEPLKKLRKYLAQLCMAHGRKLKLARVLYKKSRRKSSCFVHSRFTGVSKQTSVV